jgi:type IV secretory pathway TrbD component
MKRIPDKDRPDRVELDRVEYDKKDMICGAGILGMVLGVLAAITAIVIKTWALSAGDRVGIYGVILLVVSFIVANAAATSD